MNQFLSHPNDCVELHFHLTLKKRIYFVHTLSRTLQVGIGMEKPRPSYNWIKRVHKGNVAEMDEQALFEPSNKTHLKCIFHDWSRLLQDVLSTDECTVSSCNLCMLRKEQSSNLIHTCANYSAFLRRPAGPCVVHECHWWTQFVLSHVRNSSNFRGQQPGIHLSLS